MVFSSDGQMLAPAPDDMTVRLWDPATGEQLQELKLEPQSGWFTAVTSIDSPLTAGAGGRASYKWAFGYERVIMLWNLAMREQLHSFEGHNRRVNAVAFPPDGQMLA